MTEQTRRESRSKTSAVYPNRYFRDCFGILVVPPIKDNDIERVMVDSANATAINIGTSDMVGGDSQVTMLRRSLLQGELLDFAIVLYHVGDDSDWVERVMRFSVHVDILVSQNMSETPDHPHEIHSVTALSASLWEAQALPMRDSDAPKITRRILEPLKGLPEAVAFFVQLPLTVIPAYLGLPLMLRVDFTSIDSIQLRQGLTSPLSSSFPSIYKTSTEDDANEISNLQEHLSAPTSAGNQKDEFFPFGSSISKVPP
eukprot:GHVO01050938.1.p1 GENE.GHVO01050938.1~~GHVO01050938.1.p1  ORF type:complete len:257 (+),score=46.17 GHVO01050938.1:49-819(+)